MIECCSETRFGSPCWLIGATVALPAGATHEVAGPEFQVNSDNAAPYTADRQDAPPFSIRRPWQAPPTSPPMGGICGLNPRG